MEINFQIDNSALHLLKSEGEAYIRVSLEPFKEFSKKFILVDLAETVMKAFQKEPTELLKKRWNSDGTINFVYVGSFHENDILKSLGDYHASAYCHQKPGTVLFVSFDYAKEILNVPEFDDKLFNRLFEIADLCDNWDGEGSIPVKMNTLINSIKFLRTVMGSDEYYKPDIEDLYPTPYGSLVIDFETDDGLVSTEVGNSDFGFFTDFRGRGNYGCDGYTNDFDKMPVPETVREFIIKKK